MWVELGLILFLQFSVTVLALGSFFQLEVELLVFGVSVDLILVLIALGMSCVVGIFGCSIWVLVRLFASVCW